MIEIIAISMSDHGNPDAELFFATSEEEAEQFCELWNEKEISLVEISGGYPGHAFTAALAVPASRWIREWSAELKEVEA